MITQSRRIRVLVVDDSLLFREAIARGIASDPAIEVVGKASDPFDARDKILAYQPDVMTCDVEMPRMNGIEFIRRLLPQYPLPVIVVSSVNAVVFDAMRAGAVDFVAKPSLQSAGGIEDFLLDLIAKIKVAANAKVAPGEQAAAIRIGAGDLDQGRVVAIGASTGGTEAVAQVLGQLPSNMPAILVVQHIPPVFSRMFAERLHNSTALKVKEARHGDLLEPGQVLIAPGDRQMRVIRADSGYQVSVVHGERVNGHCPSVDVLFNSLAQELGRRAIGVILTGMGYDGARGLLAMRRRGARTLGQDEQTAVVYGMPRVAWELGAVEQQLPLAEIPQALLKTLKKGGQ